MKAVKISLGILTFVLVVIQFIPNNMPENKGMNEGDIIAGGLLTEDVAAILKTSCYDCHSNQTYFPWYSKIAPSSWLLARDVNRGREQLNFSDWEGYNKRNKIGKLEAIKEEINSGEMPLPVYIFIHRRAKLTPEQISSLAKWTDEMTNRLLE